MPGEISVHNHLTLTARDPIAVNRCTALVAAGLLNGANTADQATNALNLLRGYGWTADNDKMHNAHFSLGNAPIISTMYAAAHGRASVLDNLCGASIAAVDAMGSPVAVAANTKAASFATANGTANGAPAAVIINGSVGGAKRWEVAVSPTSGVQDFGLDVAICPRNGTALPAAASGLLPSQAQSNAVRAGIAEVLLSGNLRGKPTLIVSGRSDALLPVNHAARAYTAFNRKVEGAAGQLSYVEVANAQHFDAFNAFSGFDTRYVPLHVYFVEGMNAMYAKLKNGTALPASQVVRATPRGGVPGAAPAITRAQLPPIIATPATADAIVFNGTFVNVPN